MVGDGRGTVRGLWTAHPDESVPPMTERPFGGSVMRLGLISDTHGFLDPKVFDLFEGVDAILHAGDIGYASLIQELEAIAPVTAVLGNNDSGLDFETTAVLEAAGQRILIQHIVDPSAPARSLGEPIRGVLPHAVVFGHTHRALHESRAGLVLINPGYSGKPRLNLARTVATAEVSPKGITVTFHPL